MRKNHEGHKDQKGHIAWGKAIGNWQSAIGSGIGTDGGDQTTEDEDENEDECD